MKVCLVALFVLANFIFASNFSSSGNVPEYSAIHPISVDIDSLDGSEFERACIKLVNELKAIIEIQLNLNSGRCLSLDRYEAENWPPFVLYNSKSWDRQSFKKIRAALPNLIFRNATNSRTSLDENRSKIYGILLEKFRAQTGSTSNYIMFLKCNITGWPAGVDRRLGQLCLTDILVMCSCINSIRFLPILPSDHKRYIEFSDGTREEFPILRRDMMSEIRLDDEIKSAKSERTQPDIASNTISEVRKISHNTFASDLLSIIDSLDEREFERARIQLFNELKTIVEKQLNLEPGHYFSLRKYEIKNWPPFVPFNPRDWDRRSFKEIRAALPNLVFKNATNSRISLEENRCNIYGLLIKRFKAQTGSTSSRISFLNCNLTGWPAGVHLNLHNLRLADILAIWRCIDSIKFLPILPSDQKRYIEFSDGTREEFPILRRAQISKNGLDEENKSAKRDRKRPNIASVPIPKVRKISHDTFNDKIDDILDDSHSNTLVNEWTDGLAVAGASTDVDALDDTFTDIFAEPFAVDAFPISALPTSTSDFEILEGLDLPSNGFEFELFDFK